MINLLRVPMTTRQLFAGCSLVGTLALGQNPAAPYATPPRTAQGPGNRAPHQPPCWQQAGISKTAIDQRRAIERNTRAQVEAVCADASITTQQKHVKIKEIREQARQEIDSIITPQPQEELKTCNTERSAGRPATGGPRPGRGGFGPCGELTARPAPGNPSGNPPAGKPDDSKQPECLAASRRSLESVTDTPCGVIATTTGYGPCCKSATSGGVASFTLAPGRFEDTSSTCMTGMRSSVPMIGTSSIEDGSEMK